MYYSAGLFGSNGVKCEVSERAEQGVMSSMILGHRRGEMPKYPILRSVQHGKAPQAYRLSPTQSTRNQHSLHQTISAVRLHRSQSCPCMKNDNKPRRNNRVRRMRKSEEERERESFRAYSLGRHGEGNRRNVSFDIDLLAMASHRNSRYPAVSRQKEKPLTRSPAISGSTMLQLGALTTCDRLQPVLVSLLMARTGYQSVGGWRGGLRCLLLYVSIVWRLYW